MQYQTKLTHKATKTHKTIPTHFQKAKITHKLINPNNKAKTFSHKTNPQRARPNNLEQIRSTPKHNNPIITPNNKMETQMPNINNTTLTKNQNSKTLTNNINKTYIDGHKHHNPKHHNKNNNNKLTPSTHTYIKYKNIKIPHNYHYQVKLVHIATKTCKPISKQHQKTKLNHKNANPNNKIEKTSHKINLKRARPTGLAPKERNQKHNKNTILKK